MGLRGRILIVLLLVFAVAFGLIAIAGSVLTGRDQSAARRASLREFFALLGSSQPFEDEDGGLAFHRVAMAHPDVVAVRTTIAGFEVQESGFIGEGDPLTISLPKRSLKIELWLRTRDRFGNSLRLLLLYLALTSIGVSIFAYVAMTIVVIRPLEVVRTNAERLAEGNLHVKVPVSGARELRALATTFNQMSAQLRIDQDVLRERLTALESANQEIEDTQQMLVQSEKMASVGRLAAGIAHEIGNPLTAILGMLEILRNSPDNPQRREKFLSRIESETHRIHLVIRELLDFSRGRQEDVHPEPTDVSTVIADALSLLTAQRDLANVTIHFQPQSRRAYAVADELRQVIINLLINAGQEMSDGGEIWIEIHSMAKKLEIEIRDSGGGIPESLLGQIFEPFVTTKSPGKGTGLGLAVSQTIVERVGGTIIAENWSDGARFRIRLRPVS